MTELHQRPGDQLDPAELYALLRLRAEVFVVEQASAYQDLDGRDLDASTVHVWFADHAGPTSALRVLDEGEGRRRIGRVVTRPDARGRRSAARLIELVLDRLGAVEVVLSAQSHLRAFYEGFGFEVDGPEFELDGISHLPMRRPASVGS